MTGGEEEVALHGGTANRGLVVRVGDTVRRPQRPTGRATEALLRHLADVGFEGAPAHLGVDSEGREVLAYVPGTTVTPPYPAWALTEAALVSVAHLLRAYHEAVAGFDAAGHEWPRPVPPAFRGGLVSHNDLNLDNVVFRDGRAVALIDFDLASPGSRLWDVAGAARLWAPLRPDADIADSRRGRSMERLRLFLHEYGLPAADRVRLGEAVLANHDWSYATVHAAVADGHPAFTDYMRGAAARAERARAWYVDGRDLRDALG